MSEKNKKASIYQALSYKIFALAKTDNSENEYLVKLPNQAILKCQRKYCSFVWFRSHRNIAFMEMHDLSRQA